MWLGLEHYIQLLGKNKLVQLHVTRSGTLQSNTQYGSRVYNRGDPWSRTMQENDKQDSSYEECFNYLIKFRGGLGFLISFLMCGWIYVNMFYFQTMVSVLWSPDQQAVGSLLCCVNGWCRWKRLAIHLYSSITSLAVLWTVTVSYCYLLSILIST